MSECPPVSGAPARAVFLSYAHDDAEAARRIAGALRGVDIEVWFDQNELRGGDAWDSKIRKQIRACALLIAVVSATTEARGEGYFRREWKLAVERTHDMAATRISRADGDRRHQHGAGGCAGRIHARAMTDPAAAKSIAALPFENVSDERNSTFGARRSHGGAGRREPPPTKTA